MVDAYTRRILERHGILPEKTDYEEIRKFVSKRSETVAQQQQDAPSSLASHLESGLRGAAHAPSAMSTPQRTALVQVYNEMHGLIVGVGKNHCGKSQPKCDHCPLQPFLPDVK